MKHSEIKKSEKWNKKSYSELWDNFNRTNTLIPKGKGEGKKMAKIFPNLMKTINSDSETEKKNSSTRCMNKTASKHIIIKLLKTSDY